MKFMILNGPNLNMLGKRDPQQYGTDTLEDIITLLRQEFPEDELDIRQSNLEGELVEAVQSLVDGRYDGLMANFAGYTHSSVAIRDALELISVPYVEVHLSNIHARETFRETSLTGALAQGVIAGFGKESYVLGLSALKKLANNAGKT